MRRVAIRVFHCDDSAAFRVLVRELLRDAAELEIVGEAATIEEALRDLPAVTPDVVLLDLIGYGDEDLLIASLRRAVPGARFVVYTGMPDRAGSAAEAYLHKSAPFDELRRVIGEVTAGT